MTLSRIKISNWLTEKIVRALSSQEYLTIQIDITNSCNLKCAHCYHSNHKNTGAIGINEWYEIIEQYNGLLSKLHLKPSIVICGGEPFISPHLNPIIKKIRNKWSLVPITVLTNGTKLNDINISMLKKYSIDLQVSLDGPDSTRHDEIRGGGNFIKSIEGIKGALKANVRVNILAVLSQKTSLWIGDFFKLAKKLNVVSMDFTRLIPEGNGLKLVESKSDSPLHGIELRNSLIKIIQSSKSSGVLTNTNKPLYCLVDKSLGANGKFGFQGLVIDYKGNLKVASRTNYKLGNVLQEGLEDLFLNHPLLKSLRKGSIQGCGGCSHYSKCGGDRNMSFSSYGSYLMTDPGCWLQTNLKYKENS